MKCLRCGFENPDSFKFCGNCGEKLSGGIFSEERRLLTILFADLSGFTSFSRNLDPEDVRDAVNICFDHFNRVIVKYGGTIHKYEGDLVIALFGYPVSYEDNSERAVKASLEMMKLVSEINRVLSKKLKI